MNQPFPFSDVFMLKNVGTSLSEKLLITDDVAPNEFTVNVKDAILKRQEQKLCFGYNIRTGNVIVKKYSFIYKYITNVRSLFASFLFLVIHSHINRCTPCNRFRGLLCLETINDLIETHTNRLVITHTTTHKLSGILTHLLVRLCSVQYTSVVNINVIRYLIKRSEPIIYMARLV